MKTHKDVKNMKNYLNMVPQKYHISYIVSMARNIFLSNYIRCYEMDKLLLEDNGTIRCPQKGSIRRRKDYALFQYKQRGRNIMRVYVWE